MASTEADGVAWSSEFQRYPILDWVFAHLRNWFDFQRERKRIKHHHLLENPGIKDNAGRCIDAVPGVEGDWACKHGAESVKEQLEDGPDLQPEWDW